MVMISSSKLRRADHIVQTDGLLGAVGFRHAGPHDRRHDAMHGKNIGIRAASAGPLDQGHAKVLCCPMGGGHDGMERGQWPAGGIRAPGPLPDTV